MNLEALRVREDDLRAKLATVRERLDAAISAIDRAERAREQASARGARSDGAYRDVATEHSAELEAQVRAGPHAIEQRVRLRHEEARLLEELEKTRLAMEQLGVRKHVLPMLDGVPAASPCTMRWEDMTGNGDARTCGQCKLTVINVAMCDADRAQTLIDALGRDAKLHRRADGTLVARDCPTGVARQRFFRVALAAIASVMAIIGGLAIYESRGLRPQKIDSPNQPDPHLTIVRGAPSLHVSHRFSGMMGSEETQLDLTRTGDTFTADLTCSIFEGKAARKTTISASIVDAFLAAVASHKPTPDESAPCRHTDDYPRIEVEVAVNPPVTLSVLNCSYQWLANGAALDDRKIESAPRDKPALYTSHPDINGAYRKLLDSARHSDCVAEARAAGHRPEPPPRDPNCDPPYTRGPRGEKIWKRSCF
jgi:hypothetical protein